MKTRLLSPARAWSLAGLLFMLGLPLAAAAEDHQTALLSLQASPPTATPLPSATSSEESTPTVTSESPEITSPAATATASEASGTPEGPTPTSGTASPTLTATTSPGTPATATTSPGTPVTATVSPGTPVTATVSPSLTSTSSVTLTPPPTAYPPQSILINEIAWAGTIASSSDEWIELQNQTSSRIELAGWRLTDGGDINVPLSGTLPAFSYFLLERTDDGTIDNIPASQIYTGALSNSGEQLELLDPSGAVVDSANSDGGSWPAGEASSRRSMERRGGTDISGNWGSFTGIGGVGQDASGNPIAGTPLQLNSILIATPTPSPFVPPTDLPANAVLINEVAWSGTLASSSDEWIELHNPGNTSISLSGWKLTDGTDISISLSGSIAAHSFYLLERTDDSTVSDVAADRIYTGSLRDAGEVLILRGPGGEVVDSANIGGGGWPAGNSSSRASMERRGGSDISGNWGTYTGFFGNGADASGNSIRGTPRQTNSLFFPTPTPTGIPSRVVINEVLIRPRHDWEGTGGVTTADEFIELYNAGSLPVYLKGWWLDDIAGGGSSPYDLPGVTISPRGFAVFFRTKTKIALNDTGDTVRLMAPDGRMIDRISYLKTRAANLSYGRLPDGSDNMHYGLWPTPRKPNLLFEEPVAPVFSRVHFGLPCTGRHLTLFARAARFPSQVAWMREMYFVGCEIEALATGEGV